MADTYTDNLGLAKPEKGTVDWDTKVNYDMDLIEIALSQRKLPPPRITDTQINAGSGPVADTYYYKVTALTDYGETDGNEEITAIVNGTESVYLEWADVDGIISYSVYRGTTSGVLKFLKSVSVNYYTDTGVDTPTGTDIPVVNTAYKCLALGSDTLTVGYIFTVTGNINIFGDSDFVGKVHLVNGNFYMDDSQSIRWYDDSSPTAIQRVIFKRDASGLYLDNPVADGTVQIRTGVTPSVGLKVDENGQVTQPKQSCARRHISSAQSINNAYSLTLVNFDYAVDFDLNGDFGNPNYFVAPVDGYYQVNAQVTYSAPEDGIEYRIMVKKNGSSVNMPHANTHASNTGDISVAVSDIVYLTASDQLAVYTAHGSSGAKSLVVGQASRMSVTLLN